MKGKILLLTGLAVGYVLGTRAGRERYEEITAAANKLWNDPRVQKPVKQAEEFVKENVKQAEEFVKDKAPEVAEFVSDGVKTVASKVTGKTTPAPKKPAASTASKTTTTK